MGGRKFLQRVMLKNEDNEIFSEKIMFFFVDLSIFASDKAGVDFGDPRQKWAYYIRNIGKLYIFFGIHTTNVVRLAERMTEQQKAKQTRSRDVKKGQ